MTITTQKELLALYDYVHGRLNGQVKGMSDEEYRWEPVPGCWSVRPDRDGVFRADKTYPDPDPAPFTTIAWRLWHIGADCLQGYSDRFFEGSDRDDARVWPGTVDGAMDQLNHEWTRFRDYVVAMDDAALALPLGPRGGPYADDSYHALVLHALDEVIHHSAEVGVIRDLYRHRSPDGTLPAPA
jgi:hypothetical protein